jgi:hypothetical protein
MKTTVGQQISITRNGKETQFLDWPGGRSQHDRHQRRYFWRTEPRFDSQIPTDWATISSAPRKRPGSEAFPTPRAFSSTLPAISIFLL